MQQALQLPGETSRDFAKRIITQKLISLELEPGQMVSEKELAAELHISRTPVREALIELSKTKIIDIFPQKGIRVSLIDFERFDEARFMRQALETAIMDRLCQISDEQEFAALHENLELQKFYLEGHHFEKNWELDNAFHQELFHIAKMSQTYELMHQMSIYYDRIRRMSLDTYTDVQIVDDHEKILKAILQGDAPLAKERVTTHLARFQVNKIAILEKYPAAYFQEANP